MKKDDKKKKTLIGIDFGTRNIGLSLGKNGLVAPLRTVSGASQNTAIHEISKLALMNKVDAFVVGLPLSSDGKETKLSLKVRKFVKLLKILSKKPVTFHNEFNSSQEALKEAITMGTPQRKRMANDQIAAALVLRRYYEEE